jgi:hypothetical protein
MDIEQRLQRLQVEGNPYQSYREGTHLSSFSSVRTRRLERFCSVLSHQHRIFVHSINRPAFVHQIHDRDSCNPQFPALMRLRTFLKRFPSYLLLRF